MEIKDIFVRKLNNPSGATLGFAKVTFTNGLVIHGLAIRTGSKGKFVSWPQNKGQEEGQWYPIVECLDEDLRNYINNAVLDSFGSAQPAQQKQDKSKTYSGENKGSWKSKYGKGEKSSFKPSGKEAFKSGNDEDTESAWS